MNDDLFAWGEEHSPETTRTRTDEIIDAFAKFHLNNPDVWVAFKRFAFQVIETGRQRYSSNALFERIRWHTEIESDGKPFRMSNTYRAYYARLFHIAYPQYDGFFTCNKLTSEDRPESGQPVELVPSPAGPEDSIIARLRDILEQERGGQ